MDDIEAGNPAKPPKKNPFAEKDPPASAANEAPALPKGGGGDPSQAVEDVLNAAESGGALEPLAALIKEEGLDCTAKELMKYAQMDDRTHGKKPEELVTMFRDDPSVLDDVLMHKEGAKSSEYKGPSYDDVRAKKVKEFGPADGGEDDDQDW